MAEIWAKSKLNNSEIINLAHHTGCLLKQFETLRMKVSYLTLNYELLKTAIFIHDLGKVSPAFQISVGNWNYEPKTLFANVPHSLFSLLWINPDKTLEKIGKDEINFKILLSTVAFHHWRDNFHNILLGQDGEFIKAVEKVTEDNGLQKRLLNNLKESFNQEEWAEFIELLGFNNDFTETVKNRCDLFSHLVPPYYSYFLPKRVDISEDFKKKWIFNAGLLMRIDHFASYLQSEGINEQIERDIPDYSEVKSKITGMFGDKIWQIDELKDKRDKNIILVAPTGSGKTEFAFLWGVGNKIFFTLPLRSAVNAIHNRAESIFKNGNAGLLHSDADIYIYEKGRNQEGDNFRVLDLARHLSLPVLVSTGDQIFPSALKYPGYEKIYATLGYSKLVIDEVQAYEPKAVAVIVKLIEDVVKLGGKFLLMTATLPDFVKEEIQARIGENFELIDKYNDPKYQNLCKHRIQLIEEDLEKKIEEIITTAQSGKRVLVILNTVEKAQSVYNEIQKNCSNDVYLKLIHSRFTLEDRKKLEEEIVGNKDSLGKFSNPKPDDEKEGKILVATQVVEASLDIDADVLFTELAPIDSLVQRMGRIMRRIKDSSQSIELTEPNVFIYYQKSDNLSKITSGAGKVYHTELLILSMALLYDKAKPDIKILEDYKKAEEDSKEDKQKKDQDKQKKDQLKNLYEKQKKINISNISEPLDLSETDKKALVEELYSLLPKKSTYLKEFYDTLNILDAGYMSDRKMDAQRMFREIYTVPAIPEDRVNELKSALQNLAHQESINYTEFKFKILSPFVVHVDLWKIKDLYITADNILNELDIDKDKARKFKAWLSDIYIVKSVTYSQSEGLRIESSQKRDEGEIIEN